MSLSEGDDGWTWYESRVTEELGWDLCEDHIPYPAEHRPRDDLESVEDAGSLYIWPEDNPDAFVSSECYVPIDQ